MGHLGAKLAVTVLAVVSLLIATCGGGAPSRVLDNSSWTLESMGGTEVTAAYAPTLVFASGGSVTGVAACNHYFSEAVIGEGTITFEQLGLTAMACPDPAQMEVESAYMDALQATTNWALDGDTLTLAGSTDLVYARN
jgi:heat shock protein HslJ